MLFVREQQAQQMETPTFFNVLLKFFKENVKCQISAYYTRKLNRSQRLQTQVWKPVKVLYINQYNRTPLPIAILLSISLLESRLSERISPLDIFVKKWTSRTALRLPCWRESFQFKYDVEDIFRLQKVAKVHKELHLNVSLFRRNYPCNPDGDDGSFPGGHRNFDP